MREYRSHLSARKRKLILDAFLDDALVETMRGSLQQKGATERAGLKNPRTVHKWYRYLREIIYVHQTKLMHLRGHIEVDHHTFNARRKRRWRKIGEPDAFGHYKYQVVPTRSVLTFGLLERDTSPEKRHRVYVQVVKNATKISTQAVIRHAVDAGSTLYSDAWRGFNGLEKEYGHERVNHSRKKFAKRNEDGVVTTATIDKFWQYCDHRLARFNGIPSSTIPLHIQECAFRYNHRHDLRKALTALLKEYV